jgi:hypothetical protein
MDLSLWQHVFVLNKLSTFVSLSAFLGSKSYLFGYNKSVVDSSMQVHAKLHKRLTMLPFYCVREAVASGMIVFSLIPGELIPADMLGKDWGYSLIWAKLKVLLFWKGDTADVVN